MSHKMLRQFIVKVSVLGVHFPLPISVVSSYMLLSQANLCRYECGVQYYI